MTVTTKGHTVEKIGGTSMARTKELLDTVLIGDRTGAKLYNRIFVVSAYAGITDALLEHKKTGEPGVYALFANAENEQSSFILSLGLRSVSVLSAIVGACIFDKKAQKPKKRKTNN